MPFEKGKSGNPGGRPKVVGEVQALAREYSEEAISALRDIVRDKKAPPAARCVAANSILDRGYGRPSQTINQGLADKPVDQMTDEELIARLQALQACRDEASAQDLEWEKKLAVVNEAERSNKKKEQLQ
jgi:hypothetical protein